MGKFIDLTGKKFNRLLVIERSKKPEHIKRKGITVYWLCQCDCGSKKIVRSDCLINGNTKSCGCYNRERAKERFSKPYGEAAQNVKYRHYSCGAKKRNIAFELSKEEFFEIVSKKCFYCGLEPHNLKKGFNNHGDFTYSGIDRIDNKKGYIKGNVVPCCSICNHAKNTMDIVDFYAWVKRIYEFNY